MSHSLLISELQTMWEEIGGNVSESNKVLLEQESLQIIQKKVKDTREYLATLRQWLADAEAEINSIVSVMGEHVPSSQPQGRGTLKERISATKPILEDLRLRKGERLKEFSEIQSQIGCILAEIAGNNDTKNYTDLLVDERDLTMKRLAALKSRLKVLESENALRLEKVTGHLSTIHELSAVMSIDHSNMKLEDYSSSISDDALTGLTDLIHSLKEDKKQRLVKLQDLGRKLVELWNLMRTPMDELKRFNHVISIISSSFDDLSGHGCLAEEVLEQTDAEVKRLNSLKASKVKELVLEKQTELEGIYRDVYLDVDHDDRKKLADLIDSGNVDLSELLGKMDARIVKAKEEASGRKDILDELEKWMFACQEENWLDKYEEDEKQGNAGKEAQKNLKRAEEARILVRKIPSMVESLTTHVKAWKRQKGASFCFGKFKIISMLEEYTARRWLIEDVKRARESEGEGTGSPFWVKKDTNLDSSGGNSPAKEIYHGHPIYVNLPLSKDGEDLSVTRLPSTKISCYQSLAIALYDEYIRVSGWKQVSKAEINILNPWPNHRVIYRGLNEILSPLQLSWNRFVAQLRFIDIQKEEDEEERKIKIIIQKEKTVRSVSYLRLSEEINAFPIFFRALYFQLAAITEKDAEDRFNSRDFLRGLCSYYFVSGDDDTIRLNPPEVSWVMSEDGSGIEVDLAESDRVSEAKHSGTSDSDSRLVATPDIKQTPDIKHTPDVDHLHSESESQAEAESDFDDSVFSPTPVDSWTEFIGSLKKIIVLLKVKR